MIDREARHATPAAPRDRIGEQRRPRLLRLAAWWLGATLVWRAAQMVVWFYAPYVELAVSLLLWGLLIPVLGGLLWMAVRGDTKRGLLSITVVTVAAAALFWFGSAIAARFGVLFLWDRYHGIVSELERTLPLTHPQLLFPEKRYYVASGPPLRVAFRMPGGFIDNYDAIVYDPSGSVMLIDSLLPSGRARGPEWDNALKHPVTWMFDGQMVSCDRIWRLWYHCRFT